MNRNVVVPLFSIILLTGCMVAHRRGGGVEIVPILPAIVEVDSESHYAHGGYHYFYNDDRWYYSDTRDGRRSELPRSHWPHETHRFGWDRH